jgi:hypothetical protein
MKMPRDLEQLSKWGEHFRKNPDMSHIEDHYFITSVSKSVEWLAELHKLDLIDSTVTEPFLNEAGQSAVARNIREHYHKYVNGQGWQRDLNIIKTEIDDLTVQIDATSVAIDQQGIRLIGGRISVQALIIEAQKLLPALYECKEAAMNSKLK